MSPRHAHKEVEGRKSAARDLVGSPRTVAVLVFLSALALGGGILVFMRGGFGLVLGMGALLVGALIVYVALYNYQSSRARQMATELLPEGNKLMVLGVLAPARVWMGNGILLAGGDDRVLGVRVPGRGPPSEAFRVSRRDIEEVDVAAGRWMSRLTVRSPDLTISINTSVSEGAELARYLGASSGRHGDTGAP